MYCNNLLYIMTICVRYRHEKCNNLDYYQLSGLLSLPGKVRLMCGTSPQLISMWDSPNFFHNFGKISE